MNYRIKIKAIMFSLSILVIPGNTYAKSNVTGVVHTINFNKHPKWNGVMFQLKNDNGSLIRIDPNCGNSTWGFIRLEDELDKAILSALLMAKATQEKVRVAFNECLIPPEVLGNVPVVEWLDLGIRN